MMDPINIEYHFIFPDHTKRCSLEFDAHRMELVSVAPEAFPPWAALEFHQCPNCNRDSHESPHCPLAAHIYQIVSGFEETLSYHEIRLEVVTKQRCITQDTTIQRAVSSLMGLVIATSGCDHTAFFKPMARFHLPLANEEETIYRTTSMFMLAQYFRHQEGRRPDLEMRGLEEIYRNIQIVNVSISKRLRAASKTDSLVNAVILLDLFAKAIPCVIGESLEEIRYLFQDYLAED
jgi:hypothetical protein